MKRFCFLQTYSIPYLIIPFIQQTSNELNESTSQKQIKRSLPHLSPPSPLFLLLLHSPAISPDHSHSPSLQAPLHSTLFSTPTFAFITIINHKGQSQKHQKHAHITPLQHFVQEQNGHNRRSDGLERGIRRDDRRINVSIAPHLSFTIARVWLYHQEISGYRVNEHVIQQTPNAFLRDAPCAGVPYIAIGSKTYFHTSPSPRSSPARSTRCTTATSPRERGIAALAPSKRSIQVKKTRGDRTTNRELLTQLIRKNNEPSRMLLPSVPPPENHVTIIAPAVAISTPMIL